MARNYIKNCTGDGDPKPSTVSRVISRIIFYILLVFFVGVSVYILFFSQYLQILNINISGTQQLSSERIRQTLESYLQEKFFGCIPKNNFLLISQKMTARLLEENFKKIRTASVSKKFPDTININIDERKSLLVWCASENCFLIDENGIAYNVADFNSPEIVQNNLLRINDKSARALAIGDKIISSEYEQYALGIKDILKSIDLEVSDDIYETPSNMADEIDVRIKQGIQIYFSTQFSLESAVRTLAVVLKKEIPDDQREKLEYIDLRSEGKVFYKFKNTEPQPENKNTP